MCTVSSCHCNHMYKTTGLLSFRCLACLYSDSIITTLSASVKCRPFVLHGRRRHDHHHLDDNHDRYSFRVASFVSRITKQCRDCLEASNASTGSVEALPPLHMGRPTRPTGP